MNKIQRVIWIVLDSVGMGAMPDAKEFGDVGSNTIGNTSKAVGGLHVPNMQKMGLGNIDGMTGVEPVKNPVGMFGRLGEISRGKDTTVGHWEMVGIETTRPFPVYPDGFPDYCLLCVQTWKLLGHICGRAACKSKGDPHAG